MGRDPTLAGNFSLGGFIHCGETAPFLLVHGTTSSRIPPFLFSTNRALRRNSLNKNQGN
jgi:hypothetical protein